MVKSKIDEREAAKHLVGKYPKADYDAGYEAGYEVGWQMAGFLMEHHVTTVKLKQMLHDGSFEKFLVDNNFRKEKL